MRRAVLVSVGAHAALIAIFVGWTIDRGAPPHPVTAAPSVELIAPVAIDIALVTLPDDSAPSGSVGVGLPSATRGRTTIATTTATAGSEGTVPIPEPIPEPMAGGAMRMRGLRHDLSLRGDALERILAVGNDKPLYVPTTDKRLLPKGGTLEIRDRVTTVTVARDGTVRFKDKPDFTIKSIIPFGRVDFEQLERRAKQEFVAWVKDPYRDQRPVPIDEIPRACLMHADVCYTGPADEGGGLVSGQADITAALHRKFIGDPYASRKLKLLDTTRDARVDIGTKYRGEQLDRSAELAQRNVSALWQTVTDPAARRAALFAMWDECTEGEGPGGEAGERARAIVIGWIRAKLPAGAPGAFTVDDIARLDGARSSKRHFAPY